ncbi:MULTISPECIES: hypothetical protein [unclassified Synechocystis]|uniref:hypothetical protein n=1 Tax=unclassified Synechocystis TaxID=2640012 RepID=UPI00042042E2|nr:MULTISPECIES: hypothetical protein [unclassified Synechocystis]AIE75142.1 hypothetical protein D082_26130 [Synechocystis sp. PCC 6714]MCT0252905.1 hypothetical protein [Synechocystis sp. CS-94]
MKNKTIALFLSLGVTIGLGACGSDDGGEGGESGESRVVPNSDRISIVHLEPLGGNENQTKG